MKKNYLIIIFFFIAPLKILHAQCTNSTTMCTEITTENDSLCEIGNIDIEIIGGILGFDSKWELYLNGCGDSLIATTNDQQFTDISIDSTTTFYCKADSCDVSSCVTLTVYLLTHSQDPTSLLISEDTLCSPSNVEFNVFEGQLGTLAQWELLEDSCSGNSIATSNDGNFSGIPVSESKSYFVNAKGFCDTTSCASVDFVLASSSSIANEILFSDSIICQGEELSLHLNGGNLGTNGQWKWYLDSCGGNPIAHGDSIIITQYSTSNYFVRAEGYCNQTICLNKLINTPPHFIDLDSVTMDSIMNPSDSSWYIPDSVCPQSAVKLFAHHTGDFPFDYSITWYKNSCGSTPIDVGDSIIVYPDSTTTYYARVIGTCGASLCKSITVKTKDGSLSASSIYASSNNFCTGGSTTLSVVGGLLGSNAQWTWYEGTCSGSSIGNGSSITLTPASTTSYFVRATGGECGSSACATILINTHDLDTYHSPIPPTCETENIILEGGFPAGGTYSGLGVSGDIFDPSLAGPGTHIISYTYTDDNNCTSTVQTTIDVLEKNPDPILLSATSYEICNGNSTIISLDTNSTLLSGSHWVWYEEACSTGAVIDSTDNLDTLWVNQIENTYSSVNFIQVSPNTTTNYYLRAEGGECPPSNCIGLTVDVYTLETHLGKFNDICGVATPNFDLKGGDPSGGVYSGNGVNNNNFSPKDAGLGDHTITYTYTLGNCIATDNEIISITPSPVEVYSSVEQETCSEGGIMIHVHPINGGGFYNYQWSDGTFENPLTYAYSNNYSVLVADGNNCYTLLEDIKIDSSLSCIEMVNTFSPNGDGLNDIWKLDFSNYESANLTIFNKWGNILAEFDQTIINWDATYEGNNLPSGTYYYILKLTESTGNEINQSGPITILR